MPDLNTAEATLRVASLITEALALADRLELSMVALHLDEALGALKQEVTPNSLCSS
jgi:hypothetical protein